MKRSMELVAATFALGGVLGAAACSGSDEEPRKALWVPLYIPTTRLA